MSDFTNSTMFSGSFNGGLYTPKQIQKRLKDWDVPYKAINGDYAFRVSDFEEKYAERELKRQPKRESVSTKFVKEQAKKNGVSYDKQREIFSAEAREKGLKYNSYVANLRKAGAGTQGK